MQTARTLAVMALVGVLGFMAWAFIGVLQAAPRPPATMPSTTSVTAPSSATAYDWFTLDGVAYNVNPDGSITPGR
jgi:hypothetical protein